MSVRVSSTTRETNGSGQASAGDHDATATSVATQAGTDTQTRSEHTVEATSVKSEVEQSNANPIHIGFTVTLRIPLDMMEPILPSAEGVAYTDVGPDCP